MPGPGFRAGSAYAEVRPSLDEFQKDMERQLQEIRSKYEVPVEARVDEAQATAQGTKYGTTFGERARQSIDKALAAIGDPNLGVDATAADAQIKALRERYESAFNDAKASIDTAEFDADLARLEAELERLTREHVARVSINGDTTKVEEDIARVKEEYEAVFRERHELRVSTAEATTEVQALNRQIDEAVEHRRAIDFDIAPAERKLAELKAELEALSARASQVTAANANRFIAELDANRAQLAQLAGGRDFDLGGQTVSGGETSMLVRAETGQAIAEIDVLRAYASRDVTMDVRVESSGLGAFISGLAQAGAEMSNLQKGALALGPMLIPLGAVALGGAGGLLTLLPGAVAGLGTLKLGLGGIGEALKANESMTAQSGATSTRSGAQQTAAANAIASAQDGVHSAVSRLSSAQAAAADGAVNAAERVSSAQRGVAEAHRNASSAVEAAVERVRAAEQSLESAQRNERLAQIALTDARKAAKEQLVELSFSLADNALATRAAEIRLREARDRIVTDQQTHVTGLQLQKDQLALDEATQQLLETQHRGQVLAAEKRDSDAKGIEGSKGVVAAQQAVVRSVEGTGTAQRALATAQEGVVKAQQDGNARIATAEQSLADARRAQATQARTSAESIASAQQGIVSAQRALAQAQEAAGASGQSAAKGADAYAAAMAKLTPAGREFVEYYLAHIKPKFAELRETAAAGLLPGLMEGTRRATPAFDGINRLVAATSKGLGKLAIDAGDALSGPVWGRFIDYLTRVAPHAIETFGRIVGNIFAGFAGLAEGFAPFFIGMGDGIERLTKRFADFGQSAATGGNRKFNDFMAYVRENGPRILDIFHRIGILLGDIILALASAPNLMLFQLVLQAITGIPQPILIALIDFFIAFKSAQMVAGLFSASGSIGSILTSLRGMRDMGGIKGAIGTFTLEAIPIAVLLLLLDQLTKKLHEISDPATNNQIATGPEGKKGPKPTIGEGVAAAGASAGDRLQDPLHNFSWKNFFNPKVDYENSTIKTALDKMTKGMHEWHVNTVKDVGDWVSVTWTDFRNWGKDVGKAFDDWRDRTAAAFHEWAKGVGKAVDDWISGTWTAFREWGKGVGKAVDDWISSTWTAFREWGKNTGADFDAWIDRIWTAFHNWGIGVGAEVDHWMANLWNVVHGWGLGIGADVDAWLASMWQNIQSTFISGVNWVIDKVNSFGAALNVLAKALGFTVNMHIDPLPNPGPGGIGGALQRSRNLHDGGAVSGMLPGYSPGHDSIPALVGNQPYLLAGGEFIVRPEATRAMGPTAMQAINQAHERPLGIIGLAAGGTTWPQLNAIRAQMFPNSTMTSGFRPGANDYHGRGEAIDIGVAGNSQAGLMPIAAALQAKFGNITELIHNPNGSIKNGQRVPPSFWGAATWAQHANHVHWAMTPEALAGSGSNILGSLGSAVGAIVSYLTDMARSTVDPIRNAISGAGAQFGFPGALAAAGVNKILDQLFNVGVAKDKEATAASAMNGVAGVGGRAPAGQINNWILEALGLLHFPASFAAGIFQQIMTESGGNPNAVQGNIGDVNNRSGDLAKGIMQVIGATFRANMLPGHGNVFNPVDNIAAGSNYAMKKYGAGWFSPGPRHSHGYDSGGYLPPGISTVVNGTGAPERILSAEQTRSFDRLVSHLTRHPRAATGGESHLHLHDTGWTPNQAFAEFQRRQAFAVRQS